ICGKVRPGNSVNGDGASYPAQARPGSPAALISAQLPRKLACGRGSPPVPRQTCATCRPIDARFGKDKQPCTLANHTNFRSFSNGPEGISTSGLLWESYVWLRTRSGPLDGGAYRLQQ